MTEGAYQLRMHIHNTQRGHSIILVGRVKKFSVICVKGDRGYVCVARCPSPSTVPRARADLRLLVFLTASVESRKDITQTCRTACLDAPPLTEVVAHAEKSEVSEDEASECVQGSFMIYVFMPGAELAGRL